MDKSEPKAETALPIEKTEKTERINAYLESKLPLFSNLKKHFDSIPNLKPILTGYMSSFETAQNKTKLKDDTKAQLVSAGIYNDEEVLEFLLLIAEKERTFNDRPNNASDNELGKYYFAKYTNSEQWSQTDFSFFLQRNSSYQTEREKIVEEVVLTTISKSRANLERTIKPGPEISKFITEVDAYFQEAFSTFFGTPPPLSLIQVTHITNGRMDEFADRISNSTFIYVGNYYSNPQGFIHFLIHEGMHLCFGGFDEKMIEEGLIEHYMEEMFHKHPSSFPYSPVSEIYQERKDNLRSLFQALPEVESKFTTFFLAQDIRPLIDFLKEHLTDEIKRKIEIDYWNRGISNFMVALEKLITN